MQRFTNIVAALMVVSICYFSLSQDTSGKGASAPQNANSPVTAPTNKAEAAPSPPAGEKPMSPPQQQDFSKRTWDLPADADSTKNPVEATEESIAKGKEFFMTKEKGNCIFCHGETGAGNKENLPRLRRVPADLTDSKRMSKLTDGNIFWKITKGIPGIMPEGAKRLTEEERWQVVNFVRTLGKEKPTDY